MRLFIFSCSGDDENSATLTHGFHTQIAPHEEQKWSWGSQSELRVSLLFSVCLSYREENAAGARAPVKLQSSELTVVTCDRLSHQTSPYDIKKHTQQKYPSQLTLRSSVTASYGAGMVGGRGCSAWQGGWLRVGMADSPSQKGWSSSCLFPCFPQIFRSGCQHSVGFYNGELTFSLSGFSLEWQICMGSIAKLPHCHNSVY